MIYIIATEFGTTRENQRHEMARRTARLAALGIRFTVTISK